MSGSCRLMAVAGKMIAKAPVTQACGPVSDPLQPPVTRGEKKKKKKKCILQTDRKNLLVTAFAANSSAT